MGLFDPFDSNAVLGDPRARPNTPNVPFPSYLPQNVPAYAPSGSGGSFSDWLASLPTPQQAAPMGRYLQATGVGPDLTPALWKMFAPYAQGVINQGAAAQRSAAITGASTARRDYERNLLDAYQGMGVNPLFAQAQLAESRPQAGYQLNTQLGGIENDRLQQILGLQTGITNSIAQNIASNRQQNLDAYGLSKGIGAAQSAARSAQNSAIFGGLAGLLGSFAPLL